MECIEDLIQTAVCEPMSGFAMPSFQSDPARPIKSIRDLDRSRRPKVKKADRLLYKWMKEHCDLRDFGWAGPDGRPRQQYSERVERHLNAIDWRGKLPTLRAWEVAANRQRERGMIYLRPKRHHDSVPTIAVRVDIDGHNNEPDVPQALQWIKDELFNSILYTEASPRGAAGYVVFDLEPFEFKGETRYPSKATINRKMDELEAALKSLCSAAGFKASVELNGRYSTFGKLDDGSYKVTPGQRGQMFRAPQCRSDEDIEALIRSRHPITLADSIIRSAQQPRPASAPSPEKPKKANPAKAMRELAKLADTGKKHRNRIQCYRVALLEIVGKDPRSITEQQHERAKDRANELYHAKGLNGGERDKARDAAFDGILDWMIQTYDPDAVGHDSLWFTEIDDIKAAVNLVRSRLSRRQLRKINKDNAAKLRGFRISYFDLGLAVCTYTKDIESNNGWVPSTAIDGMLKYFGRTVSNGSPASIITKTLIGLNLLKRTRKHQTKARRGCRCSKYEYVGAAGRLPFIANHQPADAKPASNDQSGRHMKAPARHSQTGAGLNYTNLYSPSTSIKGNRISHFFADEGSEVLDDGYWASIAALQSEFSQN